MTHVQAQNILMASADREIAIALLYLEDTDKEFVFSFIAASKEDRIKEEMRLLKKTKITDERYRLILSRLINRLKGKGEGPHRRSYFKPRS
ncbi:MAG: hypothetical protein JXJ04_23565 [Spirochaetales bacterium]|nr:hypothetical protein [Spirochaetales bacterium]